MKSIPVITTWKDHHAMSIAAAHFFVAACLCSIAEKGKFVVAVSGGNTPSRLYQLLASEDFSRNIPWEKVFIFWSDERFVANTDIESNYRMVKENLLDHISIPGKNIFPVPAGKTADKSAAKYEKTIRGFFKNRKIIFDLLLLGVGKDGHTASLFPGNPVLKENKKLVKAVWLENKQTGRISFTLPLINCAAQVFFLVSGKEKSEVVAAALTGKKIKPALPVQAVRPRNGTMTWMLDEEAAATI
jgi:6-phosphogluconolactonase